MTASLQGDDNVGGQQSGSSQLTRLLVETSLYGRHGSLHVSLPETQQRQPWLRFPPGLVCLFEGIFSSSVVPDVHSYLTQFVKGLRQVLAVEVLELFGRRTDFTLRFGPRPSDEHHVGAIDATHAGESRYRLPLAPPFRGVRPISAALEIGQTITKDDRVAVDGRGPEWR